ncbi:MAG: thiamine S protein [Verrucomicrobiales bacterium]|nr:thiamine S protein [Verrucomicrobiales bacterium]|tara:strand:+ start:610 stop:855 length:246 start_codon:yes stop_codon:yes gene_type:complete
MEIRVQFFSYFRDLTGCENELFDVEDGDSLGRLVDKVLSRFPKLDGMQNSTLIAVDVEYQDREYTLCEGDVVSLFPPVQGG